MTSVESKKTFKGRRKIILMSFIISRGLLFYDQNGEGSGFGDGGIIAKLLGKPELIASDISII